MVSGVTTPASVSTGIPGLSHSGGRHARQDREEARSWRSRSSATPTRTDDGRLAARDRGAADRHGGDRGHETALAPIAGDVPVPQGRQHGSSRGEPARERARLDLLALGVDADDPARRVAVAEAEPVLAEPVAVRARFERSLRRAASPPGDRVDRPTCHRRAE